MSVAAIHSANTWRGVPITEIYGSNSSWGSPEFSLVAPSSTHAVLYHVPSCGSLSLDRPPKPQYGHDKWDHDFVRMPCSTKSLYPIENSNGDTQLKKRWEIIENSLLKPIKDSTELANAILSYNLKFKNVWKFRALHKLFNEYLEEDESAYFFNVTLPEIAKLALALPKLIQSPIPLLKQHKNRSISLSQQQISSLLANAFFCTFPRRNTTKKASEYASYPHINFNVLFNSSPTDSVMEKLKCICHYFRRVSVKVPVGVLTFSRRSVPPQECPKWPESDVYIGSLPLHVDSSGTIEDAYGLIQMDFANKYLGGGVLGHGCVQEEIRFVICPELLISMLFTEVLTSSEVLLMIGCERYSKYTGYGSTFQWSEDFKDHTPHDSSGRRRCAVLAMDALPFSSIVAEYERKAITRELNKAWVGFSYGADGQSLNHPGVATGNWGCGAFGGSEHLKSVLQLLAGAQARRPLAYYTFGDELLRDAILNVYNVLARHNVTVGQLYKLLVRFCLTDVRKMKLHAFLQQALQNETGSTFQTKSDGNSKNDSIPPNNEEKMDISSSSEASQANLDEGIDGFRSSNVDSPDLFSSEEYDALVEVKIDSNKQSEPYNSLPSTSKTVTNNVPVVFAQNQKKSSTKSLDDVNNYSETSKKHTFKLFEEMDKLDCESRRKLPPIKKPEVNINKAIQNQSSTLLEEMQKLDSENGQLLSLMSPVKQKRFSLNETLSVKNEQSPSHSPQKKNQNKKITDFFSKKPT